MRDILEALRNVKVIYKAYKSPFNINIKKDTLEGLEPGPVQ